MDVMRVLGPSILATGGDAIVATDQSGVIRFWNPGAERIFGWSSAEAVGQSLDILIPERLRARHWEGYDQVMKTGESRYGHGDLLSVPGQRKDGSRVSLEFTVIPLTAEGGSIEGMAAIMRDVTARFEETRALRQKLAASEGAR